MLGQYEAIQSLIAFVFNVAATCVPKMVESTFIVLLCHEEKKGCALMGIVNRCCVWDSRFVLIFIVLVMGKRA